MVDIIQEKKEIRKPLNTGPCCESTPRPTKADEKCGLNIVESLPVHNTSARAPSGNSCDGIYMQDGASARSMAACCISTKSKGSWIWWIAGLAGVSILFLGAGIIPGLEREIIWHHVLSNLAFVGKNAWSILPYFLFSVAISAWITVSGLAERIKAVFNRRVKIAIAGAALVGATVPLCSCGVIPFIAAMLASEVPLGPVMAFWISSPLMSPSMFVLTAGVLGMNYAVATALTAVLLGAGAGYLIHFLTSMGMLNNQLHGLSLSKSACCGSSETQDKETTSTSRFWQDFWPQVWEVSLFLGKWLLIAFILESLIVHYVDPGWISSLLGHDRFFSIPLATAIGIPVYTSSIGAIPIVKGLLSSGMGPGAALAFLVAGPVTTIPAMTAVFALVRRQTFAIYLGVGIAGSLIAGYVYQLLMS